jgi:aryl sulfotransferase
MRWWIDIDEQPTGSGPHGLQDYCQQIRTYWDARARPNVHLFHYSDMWTDLDAEMRRMAAALGVSAGGPRWPQFVEAATLDAMRTRAPLTAPDAHMDLWQAPEAFFRSGGARDWASLLTAAEIAHFDERLRDLAGDAYDWVMSGRSGLG